MRLLWNHKPYPIVASIDIGTTYSGWSFSFKDDFERCPTKVQRAVWTDGKLLSEKGIGFVSFDDFVVLISSSTIRKWSEISIFSFI